MAERCEGLYRECEPDFILLYYLIPTQTADTDDRYASSSQLKEQCEVHHHSDEEFYDADEELIDLDKAEVAIPDGSMKDMSYGEPDNFDFGDSHEDFDAIYDNAEEHDVGNVQQEHGSVLVHLLSQVIRFKVSIGMDLTKVTLPTFILERRSLLEMYADFFAHPDAFIVTVDLETPQDRFVSVVKYYLNAFYAARKSGVAKKPYNPILGETFRCRYNVPGLPHTGVKTETGPFPGSDENQLTFIAEQVSHHPPVSAFYAEHPGKRISFNAHIYTKSSFLGLSIGVANIGSGTVTLHDHGEKYTVTFPSGYGRSIMSTPWVELGGKAMVAPIDAQTSRCRQIVIQDQPPDRVPQMSHLVRSHFHHQSLGNLLSSSINIKVHLTAVHKMSSLA
uniref:Oxysterol-binding protein n=1 Tax=Angiostrongylus cantonensis TaxID=6313 RepID=A0A0K0DGR9_ANGCA